MKKTIAMFGILLLVCTLATVTAKSPLIRLDLNQDGSINSRDIYIILGFMGQQGDGFSIKTPDFNDDFVVDLADLARVVSDYGPCTSDFCDADLNRDYVVDQQDLYIIYSYYWCKTRQYNLT